MALSGAVPFTHRQQTDPVLVVRSEYQRSLQLCRASRLDIVCTACSWYLERASRVKQLKVDINTHVGHDLTPSALGTLVVMLSRSLESLEIGAGSSRVRPCPLMPRKEELP